MTHTKSIVLIGMPGSGKSTVGKLLAKQWHWPFVDTDKVIERETKTVLQNYIDQNGEDAFLAIEEKVLRSLSIQQTIVAPGGSIIYHEDILREWKNHVHFVYLKTPIQILKNRIHQDTRGIIWHGAKSFDELFANRLERYEMLADIIISSDRHDFTNIVQTINRNFQ